MITTAVTSWFKRQAAKVAAVLAAVGLAAFMWLKISLERARSDRDHHKANAEALNEINETLNRVRQAQHDARTEATQEAKRQADHRNAGSRPDTFGDSRLRD